MAKYMILYSSPIKASQRMANSTPEQMEAGMKSWMDWRDKLSDDFRFDWGMPLESRSQVAAESVNDSTSQASGYSFMESDSLEKLNEVLQTHPHIKEPGNTIEVLEVLSMPGIDA